MHSKQSQHGLIGAFQLWVKDGGGAGAEPNLHSLEVMGMVMRYSLMSMMSEG